MRPKEVDKRKFFGLWEAGTAEGKTHKRGIQTLLERKTKLYLAGIIDRVDSEYTVKAQYNLLSQFPRHARKTLTLDNGKENYNHQKLTRWLGIKTYFCDPYCPWQKGANENHNGILRRYIPKQADLTDLYQEDLDAIIEEINNRPRKCLNFQTQKEVFTRELKQSKIQKCSDSA